MGGGGGFGKFWSFGFRVVWGVRVWGVLEFCG